MDTTKINRNLEVIKVKLMNLNIKGGEAMLMADILAGIDQTMQLVNTKEEKDD